MKCRKSCSICFQECFNRTHLKTHLDAFHPVNDSALVAAKEETQNVHKKEKFFSKEIKYVDSTAKDVISEMIDVMGVDKVIELINTI